MTMYPFLTGFWASAGVSSGIIFLLFFWSETHGGFPQLPHWTFDIISALIYLAPLAGLAYATRAFYFQRKHETTRGNFRRQFTGALVGTIVILITASILLPRVRF